MKTNGNMYEQIGKTWNPLAGKCIHDCKYCSTNKFRRFKLIHEKYSGELRLDEKQLNKKFDNKEEIIFVVSQNDLFAKNVPADFIIEILKHCNNKFKTYFFQSKNPVRMIEFADKFPVNTILCTTIESDLLLESDTRFAVFKSKELERFTKQITIEPIQRFSRSFYYKFNDIINLQQVNIGANTYRKVELKEPSAEEVLKLIGELEKITVVKQKSNLARLLGNK